ncbi:flotillin family protein [Corynebacterium canis]|uniref:Flotillin family protein n=1 Tax=Corynebacterium canis TaxID=679663 RepID=A0A5C5UUB0_9CORY|nr:flotillin family protein [Corynebacterium canis]TWT28975.1 flotillin family protein [Corynebacterium canis]WJY75198.1 SPFH domain / Band 7 family protein [Corynebacterium canis]
MLYFIPKPNEALLVSGGLRQRHGTPFRVYIGRGVIVLPLIHKVDRLHIGSRSVRVTVDAQTAQNISLQVEATFVYRVNPDQQSIAEAGSRFLGTTDEEMNRIASDVFSGEVRSLVGARSVEDIICDRDSLNMDVLTATEPKLLAMGLKIDNFQINEISDHNNHINNLSQPELSRVRKLAEVSAAQADAEIEKAQQQAARDKSLYQKETDLQVSSNTMETAKQRARAAQSGPTAEAEALIELTQRRKELAAEEAELREVELIAQVIKPAEAEAKRRTIEAQAEAQAQRLLNEALASHDRIGLDAEIIQVMPEVAKNIASALAESRITMFNGGEGLTQLYSEITALTQHLIGSARNQALSNQDDSQTTADVANALALSETDVNSVDSAEPIGS